MSSKDNSSVYDESTSDDDYSSDSSSEEKINDSKINKEPPAVPPKTVTYSNVATTNYYAGINTSGDNNTSTKSYFSGGVAGTSNLATGSSNNTSSSTTRTTTSNTYSYYNEPKHVFPDAQLPVLLEKVEIKEKLAKEKVVHRPPTLISFHVIIQTRELNQGGRVSIRGNLPELGSWNASNIYLQQSPHCVEHWFTTVELPFALGQRAAWNEFVFSYK